jgi:hypothetical protein
VYDSVVNSPSPKPLIAIPFGAYVPNPEDEEVVSIVPPLSVFVTYH